VLVVVVVVVVVVAVLVPVEEVALNGKLEFVASPKASDRRDLGTASCGSSCITCSRR